MTRCPFSLSRLVKVSDTGQVVYQAEEQVCRAFPDPQGDGTRAGVKRNFQILSPLGFLAEFTQHGNEGYFLVDDRKTNFLSVPCTRQCAVHEAVLLGSGMLLDERIDSIAKTPAALTPRMCRGEVARAIRVRWSTPPVGDMVCPRKSATTISSGAEFEETG